MADTDSLGQQQLSSLAEAGSLLDRSGHEYWLFGGWAVDFHVGAVTREHDDIDLAARLDEAQAIGALLQAEGWRHARPRTRTEAPGTNADMFGSS